VLGNSTTKINLGKGVSLFPFQQQIHTSGEVMRRCYLRGLGMKPVCRCTDSIGDSPQKRRGRRRRRGDRDGEKSLQIKETERHIPCLRVGRSATLTLPKSRLAGDGDGSVERSGRTAETTRARDRSVERHGHATEMTRAKDGSMERRGATGSR
jgi:hypothetical protein